MNNESYHKTSINWYPGHMVKAQNEIKDSLKLIDIVVEVLDARIPISSRNPLIDKLAENKERIIVLNKADLADDLKTKKWKEYFNEKGYECIENISNDSKSIKRLIDIIKKEGKKVYNEKNKSREKTINIKPIYRILIIGIPNVGKSTIINKIACKNSTVTGNKPGVTKKKQWIRVSDNIDLLDTPGLLWPNLSDKNAGVKLAITGNIKDEILDLEEIACVGLDYLVKEAKYKEMLKEKYKLDKEDFECISYDLLEKIGKKRGCIISGGNVDMLKAAKAFLEDLRQAKIGKITFESI